MADPNPFADLMAAHEARRVPPAVSANPFADLMASHEAAREGIAPKAASPRPAPAKPREEAPKRKRVGIIYPQPSVQFEPGARTDGGTIIPEPLIGGVEAVGRGVLAVPGGRAASRIAAGAGREVAGIVPSVAQMAVAGTRAAYNNVTMEPENERLSQLRQASAIGVHPDRTRVTPMPEDDAQRNQAASIGIDPSRVQSNGQAPEGFLIQALKDTATGIQRRYVDQRVSPSERMRQGQREQAAAIGIAGPRVTPSASPPVEYSVENNLRRMNPPAEGEAVGIDRQMDEPLSVIGDAASLLGLLRSPGAPKNITGQKWTDAAGRAETNAAWTREFRVDRGVARGEARRTAPKPVVTIEAVDPVPAWVRPERAEKARADRVVADLRFASQQQAAKAATQDDARRAVAAAKAADERAIQVATDARRAKAKIDPIASGLRFNAQRIAAETDRADAVSADAVGARVMERGGTRAQRRALERADAERAAQNAKIAEANRARDNVERGNANVERFNARERARNKTWTANEVRDELNVSFAKATEIARVRNEKVTKARALAQIEPGQEAVVKVGDQTFRITKTHSEDPILRRALNEAIAEANKPDVDASATDPAPFTAAKPRQAPRPPPPPKDGPFAPPAAVAPKFRDALTGNDYAARISGLAEDNPVSVRRNLALERRRQVRKALSKERGATPILNEAAEAVYAGYNRSLDLIAEGTRRGAKNLGRTTDATVRAALSPAATRARALLDYPGDMLGAGANAAAKAVGDYFDNAGGSPYVAKQMAMKLIDDVFYAASKNIPESIEKWRTKQKIDVIEPREARIHSIVKALAKADYAALRALIFERTFDSLPHLDPTTANLVNDARPVMGELSGLLQDLGARMRHHKLITEHTLTSMGPNYTPHGLAHGARQQIQAGIFAPGGFLKRLAAKGVKVHGRKLTDLEFWQKHGQREDLAAAIADEVMHQHEKLDRLDALEALASNPNHAVPIKASLDEQALRVRQLVYLSHAEDAKAVTLVDAISALNDRIHALSTAREAANVSLGVDPKLRARLDARVQRIDAEWTEVAASLVDMREFAQHPGIVTVADAKAFANTAQAAAKAKIADLPNEVARISAQTGVNYIPVTEAYKRIRRPASDGNSVNLGAMQSGYIAEDLVETDVLDVLYPGTETGVSRNVDALKDMWAFGHTVANPASWINQGFGSSSLAALGRFPLWAQPQFVSKALGDILGNVNAIIDARRAGLNLHPALTRADIRADFAKLLHTEVTPTSLEVVARKMRAVRWAKGYRLPDDAMRLGMYDYNIRVRKMTPEAAAKNANHWVLNAADKPPMLTKLEQSKLGGLVPSFLSIPMQSVPRIVEGAITNPGVTAALGTLGWTTRKLFQDDENDDIRGRTRSTLETMQTLSVPGKIKDAPIEHDMSSWNPLAGFSMRGGAGAMQSMWDAVANTPDPKTGRKSTNPVRRFAQGVIGWNLGEFIDVLDAASSTRGRLDSNGEPITFKDAMTKLLIPMNYRALTADTVEAYAELDAERLVREIESQLRALRDEDAATPEVEAAADAAIEQIWRDSGLEDEPSAGSGSPASGGAIDYSKPFTMGVQR